MTDAIQSALIVAVPTVIIAGINAWVAVKTRVNQDKTAQVLQDVHSLVNSSFGQSLKVGALALKRVAEMTGKASDLEASQVADRALSDHLSKQAVVDATK